MLRIILGNPIVLNPFTMWIFSIVNYLFVKMANPTVKIYNDVLVRKTKFGKKVTLYSSVRLYKCFVDDYSYIAQGTNIANTQIGKFCSIGQGVRCGLGAHPTTRYVSTHPAFYSVSKQAQICFTDHDRFEATSSTEIGNDVWIGANAIIIGGIKVNDGAVIAAGAVITKDVPPYAIVAGVPAKIIKYRFTEEQIEFLLRTKWWDKDINDIRDNYQNWLNIEDFISVESQYFK